MSTRISRTAYPVRGAPQGQPIGVWGIWMAMIVLGTALAGLVVSGVYLYWGQEAWPPPGFEEPPLLRGTIAMGLAPLGAGLTYGALRLMREGLERTAGHLLLAAVVVTAGCLAVLVADLVAAPWAWDEHVYTSLYWVFVGYAATFVGVNLMMLTAVMIQRVAGMIDAGRHLELKVVTIFWIHTVATVASAYAMVHLLPYR